MDRRHLAPLLAAIVTLAACGGDGGEGQPVSPSDVTAADLHGFWAAGVMLPDGEGGIAESGDMILALYASEPVTGRRDSFVFATPFGLTPVFEGTFEVHDGGLVLSGDDEAPLSATIEALVRGRTLTLDGLAPEGAVTFQAMDRCSAPGDFQSSLGQVTGLAWDARGELHMVGPTVPHASTAPEVCGPGPGSGVVGHAIAIAPDGTGHIARHAPDGRLILNSFDTRDLAAAAREELVDPDVGEPNLHTELFVLVRPSDGSVVIIGTGGRAAWEKVGGAWQRFTPVDETGLLPWGVRSFVDPDGRLYVHGRRETAPGSRSFEPWDLPPMPIGRVWSEMRQEVRVGPDGAVYAAWSQELPPPTPDTTGQSAHWDELWFATLSDGAWDARPLGPGNPVDLSFDAAGDVHIGTLVARTRNSIGHVHVHLDDDGAYREHTYRWSRDPMQFIQPNLGYNSIEVDSNNNFVPFGAAGPGGEYAIVNRTPSWIFPHEGARTYPSDITFEGDGAVTLHVAGATCSSDCTVELEPNRIYPVRLDSADIPNLEAAWNWVPNDLPRGPLAAHHSLDDAFLAAQSPYRMTTTVTTRRGRMHDVTPVTGEGVHSELVDLHIRPDGARVVVLLGSGGACGDGQHATVARLSPEGDVLASHCMSGVRVPHLWPVDDGFVAWVSAITAGALDPVLGASAAGRHPASGMARFDPDTLAPSGGVVLTWYGGGPEPSTPALAAAAEGDRLAWVVRNTSTQTGELVLSDLDGAEAARVTLHALSPGADVRLVPVGDRWAVVGDDRLTVAAEDGEKWFLPGGATARAIAADPSGVLHVFGAAGSEIDLGGTTVKGVFYARFEAGGELVGARTTTVTEPRLFALAPDLLIAVKATRTLLTLRAVTPDDEEVASAYSLGVAGIGQNPLAAQASPVAVALDGDIVRVGFTHATAAISPNLFIDYDRVRLGGDTVRAYLATWDHARRAAPR